MTDQLVDDLKPTSPRNLLEELARIGATLSKHDRPRPEVELYLISGQTIRGQMISVADTGHGASALIQVGGNPRAPAVTFVRIDQVVAITVMDASVLVKPVMSDAPVPSRLDMQRQLLARADSLSNLLGRPIALELGGPSELDDDGRRAIGLAIPIVVDVITAIAKDSMGREALAKLDVIELGASPDGEVRLDARRLIIRAPKLLSEQHTHPSLRRAIEKLL